MRIAAAFLIYLALALFFFGRSGDWTQHYLGIGADPISFIWYIRWWPFALSHQLNPLLSQFLWAPQGANLAWTTSVPMAALLGLPVTLLGGPILAYNFLAVLAPAFSAFAAFLLARFITRRWSAALAGGFFYGFSSYETGHMQAGHINLILNFFVPLMVLLCIMRAQLQLKRNAFIAMLAGLMLVGLGLSEEILLTSLVFGAIAWAIFLSFAAAADRNIFYRLAAECITAGLIASILAAPFIYRVFTGLPDVPGIIYSTSEFSADLLNYVIPTKLTWIGGSLFTPIASAFRGNLLEQGAYLGPPLLVLLAMYFYTNRGRKFAQALLILIAIAAIASLGPVLHVAGKQESILLPWRMTKSVPFLKHALPARFSMYVWLIAAIAVACFVSQGRAWRFGLALLAAIFLVPGFGQFAWSAWPAQPFFAPPNIARVIGLNRTVILLPFGINGNGMGWQVQSGMAFRQAGGYTGFVPNRAAAFPITTEFQSGDAWPSFAQDLTSYCGFHHVDFILIGPGTPPPIFTAILATGWQTRSDHGILVVKVPPVSALRYFYVQGDYWPWAASGNWMGRQITVTTHGIKATMSLTGSGFILPSLSMLQSGPSGKREFAIGPGQSRTIEVPANASLRLSAVKTFVPDHVIHNGDVRRLSVLVSIKAAADP